MQTLFGSPPGFGFTTAATEPGVQPFRADGGEAISTLWHAGGAPNSDPARCFPADNMYIVLYVCIYIYILGPG